MGKWLPIVALCISPILTYAQVSRVWVADNGDGTYKNPIIHADYSDPDVIRVGTDFYMTASSFNAVPGLPILHSKDLVNWRIVNHVFAEQEPSDVFARPQHGNGVWAPAIRFHNGEYYIYYGDPDRGIYVTKAKDPRGEWSKPILIREAKGWIDPCPLWTADGKAYLVHAFAGSRAGIKSILVVNKLSADGMHILDDGVLVYDGHATDPTVEGPKSYFLNGHYYILAPAGGVPTGWQLALRSKNIYGPYERRVVLAQGKTDINGPHQGGLVDTLTGEWWFVHFQDKGAYGRIVHLEPVAWKNGFPVIGADPDGDGTGEPVSRYKKPNVGRTYGIDTPQDGDEFNESTLGLQWQWQANPQPNWAIPFPSKGVLRMNSADPPEGYKNLWDVPNLLLQKFPAESFVATAKISFTPRFEGERFGLAIMGLDYAYVGALFRSGKLVVSNARLTDADKGGQEKETRGATLPSGDMYLRLTVRPGGLCEFSYSIDGVAFPQVGEEFKAREGRWIGAKIGFFFTRPGKFNDAGTADIDWIRFEPVK